MARIDFAFGAPDRLRTACVIARKRHLAGDRVIVYCSDTQRLAAFDRLLWAFDPTSFVPHVGADDALVADTPVILTSSSPAAVQERLGQDGSAAWLLNLDDHCAPDVAQFARVMEVVSHDEADRGQARLRWRTYADAGHQLHGHDLKQAQKESTV